MGNGAQGNRGGLRFRRWLNFVTDDGKVVTWIKLMIDLSGVSSRPPPPPSPKSHFFHTDATTRKHSQLHSSNINRSSCKQPYRFAIVQQFCKNEATATENSK